MIKKLKVKHLRIWETSRGLLGYEAKTKEGSIWNDGLGDPTFFEAKYPKFSNKDFAHLSECDLEQNFDGNTQMYEGLQQLEDGLIDYIEIIQTVKSMVKNKLRNGNFDVDKEVKDKLFYEVQDLQTYANQWLPDYSGDVIAGFNKLVGDTDEEHFHQL